MAPILKAKYHVSPPTHTGDLQRRSLNPIFCAVSARRILVTMTCNYIHVGADPPLEGDRRGSGGIYPILHARIHTKLAVILVGG